MINVERYAGQEASVNSYLLSDNDSVIVVDLLRNSAEAEKLADHVEATGKRLDTILISHGHPDRYIGLGVFHRRFPAVPVRVASAEIRGDIEAFSKWMESVGWLDTEPGMKAKSDTNPDGFDYPLVIQLLEQPFLKLPFEPAKIQVHSGYPRTECGQMTTLSIPEQRAFFLAFDLLYNHVHAWCGPGVEEPEIRNWIRILDLLEVGRDDGSWIFYCGHGAEGGAELIGDMRKYLDTFVKVTAAAQNRQTAIKRMTELFPGYAQDNFLLVHSINFHVRGSEDKS